MNNKIALDTTAYTAFGMDNANVVTLVSEATSVSLPIIVLGEIYYGIFNGSLKHKNRSALSGFLSNPRVEVLNIDEMTAKIFGEISTELKKIGRPVQQNDIWIAALCKQYGYALATADKGFTNISGLEVINF